MITLEIIHDPVPWQAPRFSKYKTYSLQGKIKDFYRWQIRTQFNRNSPITGPVKLSLVFHMPIPKATPKARRSQMLNGLLHHIVKPDCSNLVKFCEDTLKEIVIQDDNQVVYIDARKIYSECPKTIIMVEELNAFR